MMDQAFQERAERLAAEFNDRYGINFDLDRTDIPFGWTDEKIEQALADYGMPSLSTLPARPTGPMHRDTEFDPSDTVEAHRYQRENAMHLLGHVMLHNGKRCTGCAYWGYDS